MTTASSPALAGGNSAAFPRRQMLAYWLATLFVTVTAAVAGTMDILRIEPLFGVMLHMGYPAYFATILGIWKVLGAVALLAPRYPRVKEWAYAGMFIDYTAAVASYVAVGDGTVSNLIGPLLSLALLVTSWRLRPLSRRIAAS